MISKHIMQIGVVYGSVQVGYSDSLNKGSVHIRLIVRVCTLCEQTGCAGRVSRLAVLPVLLSRGEQVGCVAAQTWFAGRSRCMSV